MSLHAQLSPEAIKRLHVQRRNSTISSFIIAILTIVLIGLALGLFFLQPMTKDVPVIVSYQAPTEEEPPPEPPKKSVTPEKKPSSPSSSVANVVTSTAPSPTSVPVPDIMTDSPSIEFGETTDFGAGWGTEGFGSGFDNLPGAMKSRCSKEERMKRFRESGGKVQAERAVLKALDWLKATQNEDGSWGDKHTVAMTGFSLLAYLAHCETPKSNEFGDSVQRGITYLVDIGMKNDGKFITPGQGGISWVYEHGIATYALAEATTFCKQLSIKIPNLDRVTKMAGDRIMNGQSNSGGWVYGFGKNGAGDNSVGFWQIQALKACKHTGLWSESNFKPVIEKALKYLTEVQGANGAVGYRNDPNRSPRLTGGAVLAFQMWGKGDSEPAKKGIEWIKTNEKDFKWPTNSSHLYYHYYHAQAMINEGGTAWKNYNRLYQDQLIDGQNEDGSWEQGMSHGAKTKADRMHMATCLATFMLEVYYRFLPGSE